MEISTIQPTPNQPAIFIKKKKILVFADLHIGIESQLKEQGIITKSRTDLMIKQLFSICKKYNPKDIILLGDIKHNIPWSTIQERKDVKNFLTSIKDYGNIHIVPGNHDGNIKKLTSEDIIIHPSSGMIYDNIGFVHGHRWPNEKIMECKQIITAHTHPTIMFLDRLNVKTFEPCWIKGNFNSKKLIEKYPDSMNPKVLVMPAFNSLCGGIAVNQEGIVGPLGKIIDIKNSEIYLIDGVCLGKVKDLK